MRTINCVLIFSVLWPHLREAAGKTFSNSILSTARSEIVEAVNSIQVPYDGISDPNKILAESTKEELVGKIHQYSSSFTVNRDGRVVVTSTRKRSFEDTAVEANTNADTENAEFPVQLAVAIVEGMEVMNYDEFDENSADVEELAGQFAMSLHNAWGIGHEILPYYRGDSVAFENNGGTGVLVFLSVQDRVVFISVGGALDHLLTSGRIERIINGDMKADLKRANYGLGLSKGIDAIVELLEKNEEPSVIEKIYDNSSIIITFLWAASVIGVGFLQERKRKREQRIYAKVAVQLSKLDQAKAEALRGSYQRTTSCPICFEEFSSNVLGSDGRPIQLLRCGHVFDKSCYEEWISSGYGDVTKCPVCRADVGTGCKHPTTTSTMDNHTFASNVGSQGDHDNSDRSSRHDDDLQVIDINHDSATSVLEDEDSNENNIPMQSRIDHEARVMIQYRADRNFRLERLSELYPRYVTPNTVTRWCSPTFNGSLVSDPSFMNRDPVVTRNANRSCSSTSNSDDNYGGYNFGGGTSGGGTGARF